MRVTVGGADNACKNMACSKYLEKIDFLDVDDGRCVKMA